MVFYAGEWSRTIFLLAKPKCHEETFGPIPIIRFDKSPETGLERVAVVAKNDAGDFVGGDAI